MMNKITSIPTTATPAANPRASAGKTQAPDSKEAGKADESSSAAFAAAMIMAGQQPQPVAKPVGLPGMAEGDASKLEAKSSASPDAALAQSLQMKSMGSASTGTNAGAMIAGLQSQSQAAARPLDSANLASVEGARSMKEWVFDGVEGNPQLRSLFGAPKSEALAQKLSAHAGKAGSGEPSVDDLREQVMRGEMAISGLDSQLKELGIDSSAKPMTSGGATAPSMHAGAAASDVTAVPGQALAGPVPHVAVARPQAPALGGSSSLSGAEFLGTLSALRGGQVATGAGGKGDSEGGSLSGEGKKPGFGEVKKGRGFAETGDAKFESFAQANSPAVAAGAGNSTMLNGTRTESTAKPETQIQAQVTTGSMAQDRIASASLAGISSNIRNFSLQGQGAGEIRVKLHPENLGELHLRVVTNGNTVGLQIQASDEKAKKILEGSLNDLKDSLSQHHLSLASVDVAVAQPQQSFSSDFGSDSRSHNPFGGTQDMMGNQNGNSSWSGAQDNSQGASNREGWNGGSSLRTASPARVAARVASGGAQAGTGNRRLDVTA